MHTDTDTVDIDDIDAALDASADDKEQDAAPTFAELGVPKPLVHVLAMDGKVTAFPIQADTLADSLNGVDLLGRGQTGSGKTLAFAIPLVARLSEHSVTEVAMKEFEQIRKASDEKAAREQASLPRPRGLVLAPTRELVNQIDEVIQPLAEAYGMSTVTVYGGVSYARQVAGLRAGADIVVACPGRLEDLLRQGKLSLDAVEITILDEADEMADMGFLPPVTRLLEQTDSRGQRMLFSATLDHGVDALVKRFLPDAKVHAVSSVVSQVDTMTHHVFEVSQGNKHEVIRLLASGTGKRILFTRTKFQAKKMAKKLIDEGIPAVDLQGNLSQKQRDRNLLAFEKGLVRVLVATDVAARGIDVHDVTLVVQTDPPADPKSFLHRSGRTARAGEQGDVVTLVLPNQARSTRQMMKRAGIRVKSVAITPASEDLTELVGEHAPVVEGWSLDKALEAFAPFRARRPLRSQGRSRSVRRAAGGDVPAASPAPVAASMISPVRPHAVTAIVMTADGYLITNAHTVSGAESITVQLSDGTEYAAALSGMDESSDLAVLKIEPETALQPAEFGDSAGAAAGDTVYVFSHPFGAAFDNATMTDGSIAAVQSGVRIGAETLNVFQTDAAPDSGSAGGPLVNEAGQVIGICIDHVGSYVSYQLCRSWALPSRSARRRPFSTI